MDNKAKAERHDKTYQEYKPVVFCVRCGSTRLDQNSITQLACYDCGNTIPWDGTLFSIRRRPKYTGDVTSAFLNADKLVARDRRN